MNLIEIILLASILLACFTVLVGVGLWVGAMALDEFDEADHGIQPYFLLAASGCLTVASFLSMIFILVQVAMEIFK